MSITRCPHCGTANRAGSNFCNGCGTDLRESQTLSDLAAAQETLSPYGSPTESSTAPSGELPTTPTDAPAGPPPATPSPPSPTAPAPTPPAADAFADQPWLRLEFVPDEEASHDLDVDSEASFDEGGRLVTSVQGLLTPIRIATNITDDTPVPPKPTVAGVEELSNDEVRLMRGLMSEEPILMNYQVRPALRPPRSLRIGWIFALLGVAVALPALLFLGGPVGIPHRWSGVEDTFLTIQGVAPDTLVVVYWAYDPATSSEIDLAMQPVMRHLLQRRARLAVVTTLPGGIASAERLIAQVRSAQGTDDLALAADLAQPILYAYLPGGAASLPLLARDPGRALLENIMFASPDERETLVPHPNLVVVAAARSEDVQQWLEQVQTLDRVPAIAVTAAGADPILRPYADSRQLSGLVSGFDGAYAYRQLLDPFTAPESNATLLQQIILQNWGHFALLAAIILGNLAALLGREGGV
jgi:hypothetical protein